MGKVILSLVFLGLVALWSAAQAVPVKMLKHNQRSSSGTLSTLAWKNCGPTGTGPGGIFAAPCLNPTLPWIVANGVTGSDVNWDWNSTDRRLTGTGLFWTHSYITSNPSGTSVLSDRIENLVVHMRGNPVGGPPQTDATDYRCIEGTFLAGVNSNGCGSYNLGFDAANSSTVEYNIGGVPYCIHRTMGGDDQVTGNPRGVRDSAGDGAGCDATQGAMLLYTLVQDNLSAGGTLVMSNGVCIGTAQVEPVCAGARWMTFEAAVPVPAVGWLLAPASGVLGWLKRRRVAAN